MMNCLRTVLLWWGFPCLSLFAMSLELNAQSLSVARQWDEAMLEAIRIDTPRPTVHARNLYHTSAAMFDAWAAFDPLADAVFVDEKVSIEGLDVAAARNEAISYAAYRILSQRYSRSVNAATSQQRFDSLMSSLHYDPSITTTEGDSPAALGNRIAQQILSTSLNDGANEANNYADNTGYVPVNVPMVVEYPGLITPDAVPFSDPNSWQPLFLNNAVTQNELKGDDLQKFIGPHWGNVSTFAMGRGRPVGETSWEAIDQGPPPMMGGEGDTEYRNDTMLLIRLSNSLDPNHGTGAELINISPGTAGNRLLGTHDDRGYTTNPATGLPYADNIVKVADYRRVLAEFWADGPHSETPPGHWNVLANQISDSPLLEKRIGGTGRVVDDLEWDVKMYTALNGAVHDAAIAAWGMKREYDYVRPITKIRYQGSLGQSSNPDLPSYHPDGLPLEEGLVELITADSIAPGGKHHNAYVNANRKPDGTFVEYFTEAQMVGKIAIHAWNHEPADPATQTSGTDWILATNWVPYQNAHFVTPAFAAYISGHSTFSRASAEVLTKLTGSPYFPGGLGEASFDADYLQFEEGPSEPVHLQWATYYDAADEAGISRLYGGIHVPADDFKGRIMGAAIGQGAYEFAQDLYSKPDVGWCNLVFHRDVDQNGRVSEEDLTLLRRELNQRLLSDALTGKTSTLQSPPSAFLDTTNDGFITARDALLVARRLARQFSDPTYRSIDGRGNNATQSKLGAADTPIARFLYSPVYPGDKLGTSMLTPPAVPNARAISNAVDAIYSDRTDTADAITNSRGLSDYVWQWGQFLTHDMDLTPNHTENGVENIAIPAGDPQFDPSATGTVSIPFQRSDFVIDPVTKVREQVNRVTSFIDASNVYGSDLTRARQLRTMYDGKLVISPNDLPGFNTAGLPNDNQNPTLEASDLFLLGDIRGNEQVGLTALHTVFLREHNRLADLIAVHQASSLPTDPVARDEAIYQRARQLVGAEMQIITYKEFLPAVMGEVAPSPEDFHYSAIVDPSITQTFSHALFRFGHSMNSSRIPLVNNDGSSEGSLSLQSAFFRPQFFNDPTNIDRVLKGLATQTAEENDLRFVDSLRNFLFGSPGSGGLDLLALDIQRGRDHGLPGYVETLVSYLGPSGKRTDVSQITSDPEIQQVLIDLYDIDQDTKNIEKIDLMIGALAEDHVAGSLGLTMKTVIGAQFERLRDGDRFFYLSSDAQLYEPVEGGGFQLRDGIKEIIDLDSLSLSGVLRWNTGITNLQDNVFFASNPSLSSVLATSSSFAARVSPVPEPDLSVRWLLLLGLNRYRRRPMSCSASHKS